MGTTVSVIEFVVPEFDVVVVVGGAMAAPSQVTCGFSETLKLAELEVEVTVRVCVSAEVPAALACEKKGGSTEGLTVSEEFVPTVSSTAIVTESWVVELFTRTCPK